MSRVRTRAMKSTSLSSAPLEPSSVLSSPPPSPNRDAKLGDPGPSSRASRRKRPRVGSVGPLPPETAAPCEPSEAEPARFEDPNGDAEPCQVDEPSDGEAEATEPLSGSPASECLVKEENTGSEAQTQLGSAALRWDDVEAGHAMEIAQGDEGEFDEKEPIWDVSDTFVKREDTGTPLSAGETVDESVAEQLRLLQKLMSKDGGGDVDMGDAEERREDQGEDEEDEEDNEEEESYHSGDTDLYELGHRPWQERPQIKRDIRDLKESMPGLEAKFQIVDRLGEGTFSSVYLAIDKRHQKYRNDYHQGCLSPRTKSALQDNPEAKVYVALKRIYITSSPIRIENEIEILEGLRGCRNVSQLITAFRLVDQVIVVMPYHRNDDFRHFYRHMDAQHIASYMLCLFRGLADIHARGIIHRDVKPANFLYDYETQVGVLVDFGLAQRYEPPRKPSCQHAPAALEALHGIKTRTKSTAVAEQAVYNARKRAKLGDGKVGFLSDDKRPSIKTNRAGTRGFRAPEVLLKCPDQTVAIDVWSAGVMLLSIMTQRFPVFNSNDDIEALMEIAAVFGRSTMERCALLHNRTIITNVPTIDRPPDDLKTIVLKLNPSLYIPKCSSAPTPAEAEAHIFAIDNAFDLLKRCLHVDSTKRITAADALMHDFFTQATEDVDNYELEHELTWGIEREDDGWKPSQRCDDAFQWRTCASNHWSDAQGKRMIRVFGVERALAFGQGVINPETGWCPEHEQQNITLAQ